MLTEKCIRVVNRINLGDDDNICINCQLHQHAPLLKIINNIYVCSYPLSLDHLRSHQFTHLINIDRVMFPTRTHNNRLTPHITATATAGADTRLSTEQPQLQPQDALTIDPSDPSVQFETLDLHFGERFVMTVLPNIYKAVKFIEKSLENSGKVLIGEEMGQQKATTIVIAFIMYKFRLKFVESFQIVRKLSAVSTVLDTYFIAQLCEYEPILETQRRLLMGSSCSGELRTARLKRKQLELGGSPIKVAAELSSVFNCMVASRDTSFNGTDSIQLMET